MSLLVIGIICKCDRPDPNPRSPNYYSPKNDLYPYAADTLVNALHSIGAIPVLIPMPRRLTESTLSCREPEFPELQILHQYLEICQGLILQDGNDIFPYEQAVAREAYERNIPLLGLGTALSGMVKVADFRAKSIPYCRRRSSREPPNSMGPGVTINVVENTHLYRAVKSETLIVHHSDEPHTMHSTSDRLVVSAYAENNYPEAFEATDKKFYVAVRFRPDFLFSDKDSAGNLLRYFVNIL